ncbi:MAG: hypothetical protein COW30_00605 [Rhodospirillales bacterium CG15_BIG_FIL_POST_REV_8_21_14_020_66_15]|nr:MAG: hypothetical protein COW30_00605 [Rhodospirillales bacterium CG15_BIG_FIL_POST_REV_8_21_14_020_66_15]
MTRRQFLSTVLAGLAVAGLSACGRKNQPRHPPDSEFPHDYPYFPPGMRTRQPPVPPEQTEEPVDKTQFLKLDPIQDRSR